LLKYPTVIGEPSIEITTVLSNLKGVEGYNGTQILSSLQAKEGSQPPPLVHSQSTAPIEQDDEKVKELLISIVRLVVGKLDVGVV